MKPQNHTREGRNFERAWLAVPLHIVIAVLGVVVVINWPQSPGAAVAKAPPAADPMAFLATGMPTARTTDGLPVLHEPSELDLLRDSATLGDPSAGIALVGQLLDRFDITGRGDDLYEAVQWMDRGWADGHYQSSSLPTRVFDRYCDYGALRWHWLCDRGE